ncbi:MAG: hypothetical protein WCV82_02065 [Candidatus Paceibacterota bacterium]
MKISQDGKVITMRAPDNWHAHFRQDVLLAFLVGVFLKYGWRNRIVAMPNTEPPLLNGDEAQRYRREIRDAACQSVFGDCLEPVPVIQITEHTTPEMVFDAVLHGVRHGKVYPFFVTTNSLNGVKDYRKIYPALGAAQMAGMIVLFHGEDPNHAIEGFAKEASFLKILDEVIRLFPDLRLTLEHVSTADGVEWVKKQGPNVAATVTIHHLIMTIDDVIGYSQRSNGRGCVHHICKPSIKLMADRAAIQQVVLDGDQKFFYGGDDAAHYRKLKKECAQSACGVWNTIAALPLVVEFFKQNNCLHRMEPFLSEFGAKFHLYPLGEGMVTLVNREWTVPVEVEVPGTGESVVPFWFGDKLQWQIDDSPVV